jgi:uncharacterized repeat protein (TIGR03803 family)
MTKLQTLVLFTLLPTRGRNGHHTPKLRLSSAARILLMFCMAAAISSPAQTFTTLASLGKTTGDFPKASLVQGLDGNYYEVTTEGGPYTFYPCSTFGCGTVFKISPGGTVTLVHNFNGSDGNFSSTGLALATNGDFYGTSGGGATSSSCPSACGTVFVMTAGGTLRVLHSFNGTDGSAPLGLVQALDGNFYGTTQFGGANNGGTFFQMTPRGAVTTLYNFCSQTNCADGSFPIGTVVQATNGNFYGTTINGGANNWGTVFEITPPGTITTLHSFIIENGNSDNPTSGLVQASNGKFYGTTQGGANGYGTLFEITPAGTFTTLHSFNGTDGSLPLGTLLEATDGNLYGTTQNQQNGHGTIFQITLAGMLTILHTFDGTDGDAPQSGLVQGTDGILYGATYGGGVGICHPAPPGCGTVYGLSMGLGPFVATVPTSGSVGRRVRILGTNLTGASSVTFKGKTAAFTVVSPTEITTAVPTGATTGTVQVTTPTGTLSSNVVFRVP